eukprot:8060777-Lingulodinium_polyedra.AAC.1
MPSRHYYLCGNHVTIGLSKGYKFLFCDASASFFHALLPEKTTVYVRRPKEDYSGTDAFGNCIDQCTI